MGPDFRHGLLGGRRWPRGLALPLLVAVLLGVSCGKKGPPLPPFVKLPMPAADLTAERHGDTVDVQFTVPDVNTDGTRPANVERVDVYAVTAPPTVTDDQLWKQGTKLASVRVKAPRDPNQTIDPGESLDEMEAPEGPGLDQGAATLVSERLTAEARRPVDLQQDPKLPALPPPADDDTPRPLLGPPPVDAARTYAIVGISTRGRRGPFSKRVTVPILDAPQTLAAPGIEYDEKAITITWIPLAPSGSAQGVPPSTLIRAVPLAVTMTRTPITPDEPVEPVKDALPSTPIGAVQPAVAYNVYEVGTGAPPIVTRLTKTPVSEPRFVDSRVVWGDHRCYTVRAVLTVGPSSFEGDEPEPRCVTLVDRFPPAAPKGLNAVPSERAISLIWEPNTESDVRGYIVLRAVAPGDTLQPITPAPISQTTFKGAAGTGVRYVYVVRAVDAAGNLSAPSERVEETAR